MATGSSAITPPEGYALEEATPAPQQSAGGMPEGYTLETTTPSGAGRGPSTEEAKFLTSNPDHQWVAADPSKPNTQPGIYHKSEVADMAKDPTMEHHPVDLDFVKHTAESAATSAAAVTPSFLMGPAETFAGTEAGQALLSVVKKYGLKAAGEAAAGAGLGLGYHALHQAAKLLGLAEDKKK